MKDLTQGSIVSHILQMAAVMVIGMVGQTLYYLVDLYFVSGLGPQAIAGVSAAGNITFVILALTQILNVGTGALISHAAGRKDQRDAHHFLELYRDRHYFHLLRHVPGDG